jgi:hypothetical protein
MLRVDCYRFFQLGQRIHPLTAIKDEELLVNVWFDLFQAKSDLNSFFQTFPLRISRDLATKLYSALTALVPDDFTGTEFGNEADGWTAVGHRGFVIRQAATNLETVLAAELNNFDTYFVSQKGSFSTPDLIEHAEIMLPDGIRSQLSKDAVEDFRLAGRCLAFNLGTAAAFHIARATEEVIRKYYTLVVGTVPPVKMRSWGVYHKNLIKCKKSNSKVLGWLDHIKDEYRNPVLHPDETVTPDGALVFINACSSLIIMMVTEIARLQAAAASEAEEAQLKLVIPEENHDPAIAALTGEFTTGLKGLLGSIRPSNEEDSVGV